MFQFISQCRLCEIHDEAILTHKHNLIKLGRVPLADVTCQISKLWGILFSDMIFLNVFSK